MNTKTQISRLTRKRKPTKAFKALVIFHTFTATVGSVLR